MSPSSTPSGAPTRRLLVHIGRASAAVTLVIAALAPAVAPTFVRGQADDSTTVEWFVSSQPERLEHLFDTLDLDRPGLETVRRAILDNDYVAACHALVEYYRTAPTAAWLRRVSPAVNNEPDPRADAILNDTYTFYDQQAPIRRTRTGGIEWSYNGPRNDPEWAWSFNDLYSFAILMRAWARTGRSEYARRVDTDTRDWILHNPFPGRMANRGNWRGLTTSARGRNWMDTFYGLQQADEFSAASRLMMLSSIPEHAQYLLLFHRKDAFNWTITELEGLATIGAAWPEFKDAPGWRAFALDQMGQEMAKQVYPDGAQTELSTTYQRVTVENYEKFIGVFGEFGYLTPDSLNVGVQKMWNYLALTLRPDGTTPGCNDADRRDIRDKLLGAARRYDRPDWTHVVTGGSSGTAPAAGPSVTFPWAGQVVMRSGWKGDAQWSFFDAGPYGVNHQHRDKLHLSVDAFGRALLVDSGRYNYSRGIYRDYFTGTAAHNTIRIDGRDQKPYLERATEPMHASNHGNQADWDYARGIFDGGYEGVRGEAIHTRTVIYVHDRFWVVADRIETDRPRTVEALWHFAPDCSLVTKDRSVVTADPAKGNLRIVPVGGMRWNVEVVAGREDPVQGWYSPIYGSKEPAPVAVYTADIPGTTTFTWVIVPGRGDPPAVNATVISSRPERVELLIQSSPGESWSVSVPMNAWRPTVRRES